MTFLRNLLFGADPRDQFPESFGPQPLESAASRLFRLRLRRWACYWLCGAQTMLLSADLKQFWVKIHLNWLTRNAVGTMFGGAMFAATDPWYMLMLIPLLGDDYIVWDRAGYISFDKVGDRTLFGRFVITDEDIERIKARVAKNFKTVYHFRMNLVDSDGVSHGVIIRKVYIRQKRDKDRKAEKPSVFWRMVKDLVDATREAAARQWQEVRTMGGEPAATGAKQWQREA